MDPSQTGSPYRSSFFEVVILSAAKDPASAFLVCHSAEKRRNLLFAVAFAVLSAVASEIGRDFSPGTADS
jgi:hypothetical protein